MSFVPIEQIRGQHLSKSPPQKSLAKMYLFPINRLFENYQNEMILEVKLKTLLGRPVYELKTNRQKNILIDAQTGLALPLISRQQAEKIASEHFLGKAKILKAILYTKDPPFEARGTAPVWKIDFENSEDSSFYISAITGRLVAKRNNLWRIYDFVWMLHIMDYDQREDFNHPTLIIASFLALLCSITGLFLIVYTFRKSDFTLKKRKKD